MHIYELRPRKDRRGFDLISEALPFGRLWYQDAQAAVGYAKFFSRSFASLKPFQPTAAIPSTFQARRR